MELEKTQEFLEVTLKEELQRRIKQRDENNTDGPSKTRGSRKHRSKPDNDGRKGRLGHRKDSFMNQRSSSEENIRAKAYNYNRRNSDDAINRRNKNNDKHPVIQQYKHREVSEHHKRKQQNKHRVPTIEYPKTEPPKSQSRHIRRQHHRSPHRDAYSDMVQPTNHQRQRRSFRSEREWDNRFSDDFELNSKTNDLPSSRWAAPIAINTATRKR